MPLKPKKLNLYTRKDTKQTFAVPSDSVKWNKTAKAWMGSQGDVTNDVDNQFDFIEIQKIDYRYRSNAVLQVKTNTGLMLFLRYEEMFEALITAGCEPGGKINKKCYLAVDKSNIILVAEGTPRDAEIVKSQTLKDSGAIKQLEIGGIYKNRRGDCFLYLGKGVHGHQTADVHLDVNKQINLFEYSSEECLTYCLAAYKDKASLRYVYPPLHTYSADRASKSLPTAYEKIGQLTLDDMKKAILHSAKQRYMTSIQYTRNAYSLKSWWRSRYDNAIIDAFRRDLGFPREFFTKDELSAFADEINLCTLLLVDTQYFCDARPHLGVS